MKTSHVLALLLATLVAMSCSTKYPLSVTDAVVKPKVIKVWGELLTVKPSKWSVKLGMQNISNKPTIVLLSDIQCFRGDKKGNLEHSFAGIGERKINFFPNQIKKFHFLCDYLGTEVQGNDYRLVITNVYDNPSGDSATPGKAIAKNVVWNIYPPKKSSATGEGASEEQPKKNKRKKG